MVFCSMSCASVSTDLHDDAWALAYFHASAFVLGALWLESVCLFAAIQASSCQLVDTAPQVCGPQRPIQTVLGAAF